MDTHVHDFSGFLPVVHVGSLPLPVYFLFTTLSFIVGLLYIVARGEKRGFSRNRILDVSLVIMISGFVGSRLFHVLVEEPAYYWAKPTLIFDIWSGGFVWFGGALLAAASGVWFLRLKNERIGPWLDLFAPVGALGYAIGRMACFATGCCFGKVFLVPDWIVSTGIFNLEAGAQVRFPTQLLAVLFELFLLSFILKIEGMQRRHEAPLWFREPGQIFYLWMMGHGFSRLLMESLRADPRGPAPLGLSVATWLSLALILSAAWIFSRLARASRLRD